MTAWPSRSNCHRNREATFRASYGWGALQWEFFVWCVRQLEYTDDNRIWIRCTDTIESSHLLDNIGAEFLNRKGADIADELTNDSITEPVVIEVENVLDNLKMQIRQAVILFLMEKNNVHNCRKDLEQGSARCRWSHSRAECVDDRRRDRYTVGVHNSRGGE